MFLGLPRLSFLPSRRSLENIKITYHKIKEKPTREKKTLKKTGPSLRKLPEIKKEEILRPPKAAAKKITKSKPRRKVVARREAAKEKKFETVVKEEQDDSKRATYISYYRAVREKIRQRADKKYPKKRNLAEGEVFLSFVVASSGELLQIRIVDEKSTRASSLRNMAINSVRDASPFPPFPKGMGQYQITFNVIISFETR